VSGNLNRGVLSIRIPDPTDAALLLLLLILLVIWVRQRVGIWRLARRYHRRAR